MPAVDNSINGLVQEASAGTVNFQGSQAFGWFTLPNTTAFYKALPAANPADPGIAIGNDCIAAAQKSGIDKAPFTYMAVYINDSMPSAAGVSWTASLPKPSPTTWNALIVSSGGLFSPPLVLHELGHILSSGGHHTDSGSDPLGGASWLGYFGSPTSVSPGWDASRRELMGFIPLVATFSGGTQTYNLSRLTQPYPGLPSAIDVPLPNGAKYVISARTYTGHDALFSSILKNLQVPGQPEEFQNVHQNPRVVEFIPLQAVPRRSRMRVVIVVPAFAERDQRHPPGIARIVAGFKAPRSPHVRGRIYQPRGMQPDHRPQENAPKDHRPAADRKQQPREQHSVPSGNCSARYKIDAWPSRAHT